MKRKLLAILASVLLLCSMLPLGAVGVSAETSGTTGDCTWRVDGTHLTISGNGAMGDYGSIKPWAGYWIKTVTIEEGVTVIGKEAFRENSSIESITLPNSLTTIKYYGLYGCIKLTSLNIPRNVAVIGECALGNNQALISINVDDDNPNFCDVDGVLFTKDKTQLIQCPGGKSGNYVIPNGVQSIEHEAFWQCNNLESVVIPNGVSVIREEAFGSCANLKSVTIPQSVTTIESRAFTTYRSSLTDVYYAGTEADKDKIAIINNDALLNATWHYADDPISDTVDHSVMDTERGNGLAFRFELTANGVATKNVNTVDLTNATINYLGNEVKLIGMGAMLTNDATVGSGAFTLDAVNGIDVLNIPTVYMQEVTDTSCAFATRLINIPDTALDWMIYARPYYIVEVEGEEIVVYGDVDSATCAQYM